MLNKTNSNTLKTEAVTLNGLKNLKSRSSKFHSLGAWKQEASQMNDLWEKQWETSMIWSAWLEHQI